MIINRFGDLNRRIYLYGTSKKLDLNIEAPPEPLLFIIMPESRFKIFWNFTMVLLMFYTATFVPYRTAFIDNGSLALQDFEWAIDGLFWCDLIVNFLSAYEDKDKNTEVRWRYIVYNYVKTWLLLDIMACFPF
jgi:hypothetical protein